MVIAADGTKWSCASCLKGHRVSGCNHTDRELKLVPKKGRPVTQCSHCRQERKKRSAHVKCECAEPDKVHHSKEKCIHLREAEERNKSAHFEGHTSHEKDIEHLTAVAEEQGCCCHHGGKCSCALLRKNSTDDDETSSVWTKHTKPRLDSTRSDGSITVFANGHHKPAHRNHGAHERNGMPYRLPVSRSNTEQHFPSSARRSVDNLALSSARIEQSSGPSNTAAIKVEAPPPAAIANLFANAGGLTSNKLGIINFAGVDEASTGSIPSRNNSSAFMIDRPVDMMDNPIFPDWTNLGSDGILYNESLDMNNLAQPALTAASSGTQSEIDEIPSIEDVYTCGMPSIQEDMSLDQIIQNVNSPSQNIRRSLPPNFFGNADFTIPDLAGSEWQVQDPAFESEAKPMQYVGFNDPWQNGNSPVRNAFGSSAPTRRPIARSVGSGSAPNADVLKQLFPDMDLDIGMAPPSPRSQIDNTFQFKYDDALPDNDNSGIIILAPEEAQPGQSWEDGSMSIPNDAYNTAFTNLTYPSNV